MIFEPGGESEELSLPAHGCTCAQDHIPEGVCRKIDEPVESSPSFHWRKLIEDLLSLRD